MSILEFIQPRPKKPLLPKKPKQYIKKNITVWSSNDGTTTLADILYLIPDDVPAENINISITQAAEKGVAVVQASYSLNVINVMYDEQTVVYEQRMQQYEKELNEWATLDDEWLQQKQHFDAHVLKFQLEIIAALDGATG